MNDDCEKFLQIERKRRNSAQKEVDKLLVKRKAMNIKIVRELDELKKQREALDVLDSTIVETAMEERLYFAQEDKEQFMDTSCNIASNVSNVESNVSNVSNIESNTPSIEFNKKEINIQISDFFLGNYVFTQNYISAEKMLQEEKNTINKMSHFKLKLLVNKRVGQITTDVDHLYQIINILRENKGLVFYELVIIKLIEQAKLQVSNCFESYKPYGILLAELYTPELHSLFLVSLLDKKETGNALKSIYSVYFEFLRLRGFLEEAYNFFSSLLNEMPTFDSFFVIESYLIVLGHDMLRFFGKSFKGILHYIVDEYFARGRNDPSQVRIVSSLKKLLQ